MCQCTPARAPKVAKTLRDRDCEGGEQPCKYILRTRDGTVANETSRRSTFDEEPDVLTTNIGPVQQIQRLRCLEPDSNLLGPSLSRIGYVMKDGEIGRGYNALRFDPTCRAHLGLDLANTELMKASAPENHTVKPI